MSVTLLSEYSVYGDECGSSGLMDFHFDTVITQQ